MKKHTALAALLAALALFCAGCGPSGALFPADPAPEASAAGAGAEARRLADAQLGLLRDLVSDRERERVLTLLERLAPLRQARLEEDRWQKSAEEEHLLKQLNRLYERYTIQYLGDGGSWGYGASSERVLAEYVVADGSRLVATSRGRNTAGYTEADFRALWAQMRSMLPEGAFDSFGRFTVFTDGVDGTLAYVVPIDDDGAAWEIAVDPADSADGDWFTETVLHEYCHYLTLNDAQVVYQSPKTAGTYGEEGLLTALPGAYLDDFYHAFWADTLDDRLSNAGSYNFFLRHEDDFITDYASTAPAEDIAESFTYFVLWPRQPGEEVWVRKLNFFYDYPELVAFREQARLCLGLE